MDVNIAQKDKNNFIYTKRYYNQTNKWMVNTMKLSCKQNLHPKFIILGYCLLLCRRNTNVNISIFFGKKCAKKYTSPFLD
jgi:hypothetical protein